MEKKLNYHAIIRFIQEKNVNDLMSILRVRIQIFISKWLFTGKIYSMCKYEIIDIDLKVNKGTFFKFEI